MRLLSDSHAHLQQVACALVTSPRGLPSAVPSASAVALPHRLVLCGTHPHVDWDLIARLADLRARHDTILLHGDGHPSLTPMPVGQLICGFGVHPWFVDGVATVDPAVAAHCGPAEPDDCTSSSPTPACGCASTAAPPSTSASLPLDAILAQLEAHLRQYPQAIVGEIGLDKLRGPPESAQVEAFLAQMRLAARYGRPVSVHCVRQHGLLLQLLQALSAEDTPPSILLHGFTGSTEVVKSLLKLKNKKYTPPLTSPASATPPPVAIAKRIFFGVGASTSFRVKHFKTQTLPLLLREGRAVLETDEHYSWTDPGAVTALQAALSGLAAVMCEAEQLDAEAHATMEKTFDCAFASVTPASACGVTGAPVGQG